MTLPLFLLAFTVLYFRLSWYVGTRCRRRRQHELRAWENLDRRQRMRALEICYTGWPVGPAPVKPVPLGGGSVLDGNYWF